MIVVEGCDGTGKSTLVERLCAEFHLVVGERGTKDRDKLYEVTFPDTMRALSEAIMSPGYDEHVLQKSQRPIVWDRLFFSDFVYAPIQQRPVAFNQASKYFIKSVMESMRCPIVYCRPPDEVIHANVESERHQMPGVRENTQGIIEHYHKMFTHDKGKLNVVTYDYTTPGDIYLVFGTIANYLQDRREQRAHI